MPTIRLDEDAQALLASYSFPGNIRQLRNIAEQISVVEEERFINATKLNEYLPRNGSSRLPALIDNEKDSSDFSTERDIMYKILFDMRSDINDLKKLTLDLINTNPSAELTQDDQKLIQKIYNSESFDENTSEKSTPIVQVPQNIISSPKESYHFIEDIEEETEPVSLQEKEVEMIQSSLEKHKGKRKLAAEELGISERTLYRKIKQYNL
jgi:transcriptional regulator with PAS, ATPase and Fis domain